jgi:hypothetical protein
MESASKPNAAVEEGTTTISTTTMETMMSTSQVVLADNNTIHINRITADIINNNTAFKSTDSTINHTTINTTITSNTNTTTTAQPLPSSTSSSSTNHTISTDTVNMITLTKSAINELDQQTKDKDLQDLLNRGYTKAQADIKYQFLTHSENRDASFTFS